MLVLFMVLQLVKMPRTPLEIGITVSDLMALFFFGAIFVLLYDILQAPPHAQEEVHAVLEHAVEQSVQECP